MTPFIVHVCAVIALASSPAFAQWLTPQQGGMWGQGQGGWGQTQGGMWGQAQAGRGMPMQQEEYETCIGKNTNGDELRVTFSSASGPRNNWANPWGNQGREMRVNSVLSAGQSSNLMGAFQLVVTTGSRVEEGCMSEALGNIVGDNNVNQPMFNLMFGRQQRRTRRGVIGNPIFISPGKSATSSEMIDQWTMRELRGRGLGLCRADAANGDRCYGLIPLCCKIGSDSQPATTPFYMQGQGQFMGQGGFGMQGGNMMGGVMGGMNNNQGLSVALPQGMNQGAPPQGVNPALPQNLPGSLNTGGGAVSGLF